MPISKHVKFARLTAFTRSMRFNKLLRQTYKWLPLPWHIKQRLKKIYLRRPGAWELRQKDARQLTLNLEALSQVAAGARQFDPAKPEVLVIDLRIPEHGQDSDSIRMFAILDVWREMGFGITFVSDSENHLPHYQEALKKNGIDVLYGFDAARAHLVAYGGKYHCVLLSRPEVAYRYFPYVRACALYSKVIYDTAGLCSPRSERELQVSDDSASPDVTAHFRRIELFNTASADLVLVITEEEKDRLRIGRPNADVAVLPNIYKVYPPTSFARRKGLLFAGGFSHKPNEDEVISFIKDVLPRITEKIPDLVFYIIGSNMPGSIELLRSANVEPLGYVADAVPYFESCRVFVAPLLSGAEIKSKVGQSLLNGLPVVTTCAGAEGMGLEHEKHLLAAGNPENFAAQVLRLYDDEVLWQKLSAEALTHLYNDSFAAARKQMAEIFTRTEREPGQNGGDSMTTISIRSSCISNS